MARPRQSSIDGAKKRLKAHIPFRADDFTRGKKTGQAVGEIERNSDGFEPFADVLNQAVTPHTAHGRRKSEQFGTPSDEEVELDEDEDGEMSMELDDEPISTNIRAPQTPRKNLNRTPRQSVATTVNLSVATSRQSNRSSFIDFDSIPSPRPSTSTVRVYPHRNGSLSTTPTRIRSNLSQQTVIPSSPEEENSSDKNSEVNGEFDDFTTTNMDLDDGTGYDMPAPEPGSPEANHTSFTEMDRTDDDPPRREDPITSSPPRRREKGKGRVSEEDADQVEEEIARGLDDVDGMNESDIETAVETSNTRSSKKEKKGAPAKEKKKPAKRKVEVRVPLSDEDDNDEHDGLRRGKRKRYKPLEWWRLERVTYGRRESGTSMVPVIKDIIRIPKEETKPLGATGKRSSNSHKPRSRSKTAPREDEDHEMIAFNPEEGWDDQTDPYGVVLEYGGDQEVSRRLAFTAKMIEPKQSASSDFAFTKVFTDGEFIASGQVVLPVGGKKPSKSSKDNTYVFFVIEGAINLKIHRTSFILAQGAMFLVPRGNTYYLENISQRPAKLFFAQARRVADDDGQSVVRSLPGSAVGRKGSANPDASRQPSHNAESVGRSPSAVTTKKASKSKLNGSKGGTR